MGMQDAAGAAAFCDRDVEKRLRRRRSAAAADDPGVLIAFEDVGRPQGAFGDRAGRDREAERPARDDRAEVAARAERPAARVEALADGDQATLRDRRRAHLLLTHAFWNARWPQSHWSRHTSTNPRSARRLNVWSKSVTMC